MLRTVKDQAKQRTSTGVVTATKDLWSEWQVLRQHRAGLRRFKRLVPQDDVKLHVGCGPNVKAGWINIDLCDAADVQLDLREALPFADASASIVYGEHFFEHLDYPDSALSFLGEAHRVLKPEGVLSIAVPDCERSMMAYAAKSEEYLQSGRRWHPEWCNTFMHHVNYDFRQRREHKYAYDFETLATILTEAGFVSASRRAFDPGLDTEARAVGSLYVDARKPAA